MPLKFKPVKSLLNFKILQISPSQSVRMQWPDLKNLACYNIMEDFKNVMRDRILTTQKIFLKKRNSLNHIETIKTLKILINSIPRQTNSPKSH